MVFPSNKIWFTHAALSTLLTCLVLVFSSKILTVNSSLLNGLTQLKTKTDISNMYFSGFYENYSLNQDIVLVNIGGADRGRISDALLSIKSADPKVIGLDVSFGIFNGDKIDSNLISALSTLPLTIVPETTHPNFGSLANVKMGSTQLIQDETGRIKYVEFSPEEPGNHFCQHIAAAYANKNVSTSCTKEINFQSDYKNYKYFELEHLEDPENTDLFKNKIVLVGYAGNKWGDNFCGEDQFVTPIDKEVNPGMFSRTPGVVVHANIIQNILDKNFIKEFPNWLNGVIVFLLIFGFNLFYLKRYVSVNVPFYFFCRIMQIITVGVIAYMAFICFDVFRLKLEFNRWMVASALSFDACMFYILCTYYLSKKYGYDFKMTSK